MVENTVIGTTGENIAAIIIIVDITIAATEYAGEIIMVACIANAATGGNQHL